MHGYRLKIPSLRGSGDEWTDKDIAIVHAVFTLIEKFVEEEWCSISQRRDVIAHDRNTRGNKWFEEESDAIDKIEKIYNWWIVRKTITEGEGHPPIRDDDDEMLRLMIDIRPFLWQE